MATQVIRDAFGNISGVGVGGSSSWPSFSNWPGYFTTPSRTETMQPFTTQGQAAQIGPQTAQTNLGAAAQNTQLADLINAVNQAAQQAANRGRLGPGGEAIQNTLLENVQAGAAGVLDPTTEQMMRANIAARYGSAGMGIDSPALYSAYVRGTGQNIQDLENKALQNYVQLLAANPAAPVFNMGDLAVRPETTAAAARAEADRQEQARQFALTYALQQQQLQAQNQRAADQLAYQYAALGQGGRGGGGGGGYGLPLSAAASQTRTAPTTGFSEGQINPFTYAGTWPETYTTTPEQGWQNWLQNIGWGGATEPETTILPDYGIYTPDSAFWGGGQGYEPAYTYEPTESELLSSYFGESPEIMEDWGAFFE